jgi:type II secretory pathway predicted ATPase ExeA
MFLNFFGLRQTPFGEANPPSLFWTPQRQDLAATIRRTLAERQGMVMLTGEDGSGKTTFVHAVLNELTSQSIKVISLPSEKLSFSLLLDTLIRKLGGTVEQGALIPVTAAPETASPAHLLAPLEDIAPRIRALHAALLAMCAEHEGSSVVLVIDDAHQLPVKTLKDFHWLSVLEKQGKKLLQIVLIGNATLLLKLEMPQLQQLKRRMAAYGELTPFSFEESFVYLVTRIRAKVGPRPSSPLFSVEALRLLARHGKGNPRTLNTLANAALHAGATRQQKPISGPLMLEAIAEARALLMLNRPNVAQKSPLRPRANPQVSPRRVPSPLTARPLRAASLGALAAALLLFAYQGTKSGWGAMWQKPFEVFRKSTVAQASPGTGATPPVFSLPEEQSQPPEILPLQSVTPSDQREKKRRKLEKQREKGQDSTGPATQSAVRKNKDPEKATRRPSGSAQPSYPGQDRNLSELSTPGKILYRTSPDRSANQDRLFDE